MYLPTCMNRAMLKTTIRSSKKIAKKHTPAEAQGVWEIGSLGLISGHFHYSLTTIPVFEPRALYLYWWLVASPDLSVNRSSHLGLWDLGGILIYINY